MNKHIRNIIPLTLLRISIGWLFLNEGIQKLCTSGWTSELYLGQSKGPLKSIFSFIAANDTLLLISDYSISILLFVIGTGLILGLLERINAIAGILLLLLFYLAYPPIGSTISQHTEGNYLLVDKNMIIACALWVIWKFNSAKVLGIDSLLKKENHHKY